MPHPKVTSDLSTPQTSKRKNSPIKLEDIYELNVSINDSMRSIKADLAEVKNLTISTAKRTQVLEENFEKLRVKSDQMEKRIIGLEQSKLRSRMEIKGVDKSALEKVKNWKVFVVDMLRKFEVKCDQDKIERAYKKVVNTKTSSFPLIVVWFKDEDEKERIMREKFDYQKKNQIKSDIYLNHCLTNYNRALYTKVLKVKAKIGIEMVFVRNGKVTIKENRSSIPISLHTFEELEKLMSSANN